MKKTSMILGAGLIGAVVVSMAAPVLAKGGDRGDRAGMRGAPIVFSELDTNGDGVVTKEELEARQAARFTDADANGDGQLTAEELIAAQEARESERKERRAARMIERLDTNDDGQVSAEEMAAFEPRRSAGDIFDRLDANEDGQLTEEEFAEARSKAMKKRGGDRAEQDAN